MNTPDGRGTWIDPKFRDTAWYLFHDLFMCRINNLQTMSIDYVKIFGIPSTGDLIEDKAMANEKVIRMLTISQMAEYFKNGITVQVVNYKDTKIIYERISDHLNAWKENIRTSFSVRNAPLDDLLLLDKLASAVYKFAAPQFTTEIVDSLIARRISGTLRVNRENILAKPKNVTINAATGSEEVVENKLPERQSMAELFSQSKPRAGASGKWK